MFESIVSQFKKDANEPAPRFYTEFQLPYQELSIHVDQVGDITFPITAKVAKSLIVEAEPARYGLKDKTLLDKNVRDTWEIPSDRVKTNLKWDSQLKEALQRIQKDLNLDNGTLSAELHNLLIYMPGQFFKGHQDSEKTEGMLATLIVLLPSDFKGGEFIIDQHGDRKVLGVPKDDEKSLTFTAFYTDCHHEVKEVISGYRVALTYNLIFQSGKKPIPAIKNPGLEKALKSYFSAPIEKTTKDGPPLPRWFVYLLDHECTRSGLDWQLLRGVDRNRVGELLACADQLNLTAHLALADIHETWSAEGDDSWGRDSRRRWHYDEDDDEKKTDDYTLTELIQDEIVLRHWVSRSGEKFEERDKYIGNDIVCWTKAVDHYKPFRSEYEGYMGNYGNTLDRWYHRVAIILWRSDSDLVSLFSCDTMAALRSISKTLKKDVNEGRRAVQQILPYWQLSMSRSMDPAIGLEVAHLVRCPELALSIAKALRIRGLSGKNLPMLMGLIDSYGENWLITVFTFWRENRQFDSCDSAFNDLEKLVSTFAKKHRKISNWILNDQLSLLFQGDVHESKYSDRKKIREEMPEKRKILKTLLNVCNIADEFRLRDKLVDHLMGLPNLYPETELTNLFLYFEDPSFDKALLQLGQRLQERSVLRKEGDWSIRITDSHNCSDCRDLKNFLKSASTQKLVWPLAKDRRAHIHQMIERMDIPVTHETLHQGSPHKLVLTKTSELFRKDKEHSKLVELCLAKLRQRKIIGGKPK